MQLKDVGMQIATRVLDVGGKRVTVVIGKPEKFPDAEDYYCPYRIVGLGNERKPSSSLGKGANLPATLVFLCRSRCEI